MYAIVDIAGRQYKVRENDQLFVPSQSADVDTKLTFDRVLLVGSGDGVTVGKPVVEGASVTARVVDHVKGDKVLVFKKKRRKGYRVKNGHRQPFTRIEVQSIKAGK